MLVFDGIRMGAMIELNGKFLGNASNQFQRYTFTLGADAFVQQPNTRAGLHAPAAPSASAANTLKITFGAELGIPLDGRFTYSNQIDWASVK